MERYRIGIEFNDKKREWTFAIFEEPEFQRLMQVRQEYLVTPRKAPKEASFICVLVESGIHEWHGFEFDLPIQPQTIQIVWKEVKKLHPQKLPTVLQE